MEIDFKKYRDKNYLKHNSQLQSLISTVNTCPSNSPYLSSDIKSFILSEFKFHKLEELPVIIEKTIFFFKKGDYDDIYKTIEPHFKK